jgi:hypothetical protein
MMWPVKELQLEQLLRRGSISRVWSARMGELWAGYGSVWSLQVTYATSGGEPPVRYVVKHVAPPSAQQPSSVGHARKLRSYVAEAAFYQHAAPLVLHAGSVARAAAPLPEPAHVAASDTEMLFILSDLRTNYPRSADALNLADARAALSWLAAFHATFYNSRQAADPGALGLWPRGSYWHLATRREELAKVSRRQGLPQQCMRWHCCMIGMLMVGVAVSLGTAVSLAMLLASTAT